MVVMTVACGDSGRRSKTKRAGVGEKAATKNGLGLHTALETHSERPVQHSSSRDRASSCLCPYTPGLYVPQIEHIGDPAALAVLSYRCESPKLEALAAWASPSIHYRAPDIEISSPVLIGRINHCEGRHSSVLN
jgi:hypothetical protein